MIAHVDHDVSNMLLDVLCFYDRSSMHFMNCQQPHIR